MAPATSFGKTEWFQTSKKEGNSRFIWIYGNPTIKSGCYEFHPDLQDHIEEAYLAEKKTCKVSVFGTVWTLDLKNMKESSKTSKAKPEIRRVRTSQLKKLKCIGVAGAKYAKTSGFQQSDDICAVCYDPSTIPTRIEKCGHIFCFLCLKTNYILGNGCPTCRGAIPYSMFQKPIRADIDFHIECPLEYAVDCAKMLGPDPKKSERESSEKYYWLYQSNHSGWFRYDPKTEYFIEENFKRKNKSCEVYICGLKMTINFKRSTQEIQGKIRKRKIKRIAASDVYKQHDLKGIAGIRTLNYPIS
ncbi:Protein CBG22172 [Caenorhabditis briggsae]|uniref:Protein CBG22172 n=2 Tax=Caenorhabditis briggsae TaxID=6238 RepID=A8Y1Q4_CAEBR|nr:Protein CBG22172 [Caenorhabditis briggsae]ULU09733.1 hypothetical protein L3Y34_014246 [Caenorhabditis briggsae]CAP38824.1 Protein CBG22172 [Caenorhabditis briggsae]